MGDVKPMHKDDLVQIYGTTRDGGKLEFYIRLKDRPGYNFIGFIFDNRDEFVSVEEVITSLEKITFNIRNHTTGLGT
jgi:hypothetical protein